MLDKLKFHIYTDFQQKTKNFDKKLQMSDEEFGRDYDEYFIITPKGQSQRTLR